MKLLLQWARMTPQDWTEIDSSEWATQPKRPTPLPGELGGLDETEGWCHRLNCQGVIFDGDHYSVIESGADLLVSVWNDDPNDFPNCTAAGYSWASGMGRKTIAFVWTFKPIGDGNTIQSLVIYAEPFILARYNLIGSIQTTGGTVTVLPWSDFIVPADDINTRHGVWVENDKNVEHEAKLAKRGWREWAA